MNLQSKYVKAKFVPSGSISYNQQIAKKYYKSQMTINENKKTQSNAKIEKKSLENETISVFAEKYLKRAEIEKWLKSMDLEKRIKIFSTQNKWLSQMIQQMFYYYRINPNNRFLLKPDDINCEEYYLQYYYNETQQNYLNFTNENNYPIDIFFKYTPYNENMLINDEKLFLEKLRFFDLKENNDSFTFSVSLLNNIEEIFYFFDLFSKKKAFVNPCT